jgi:hypothetical protein
MFGMKKKPCKKDFYELPWSVPIPPDLLARLRGFSPVLISKKSCMYLDDVFDILKGNRQKTSPEVIELLENVLKQLEADDERLEAEAMKMNFMIRGFERLEQKNKKRELNRLPTSSEYDD